MKSHQGEQGLLKRLSVLALPILLAMLLASCGGGGGLSADAGSLSDTNSINQPLAEAGGELLPLGSALPALPQDSGTLADNSSRSTSAVKEYDGSDFLVAAGGTVVESSLLLESSEEDAAWAMYKADGLQNQKVNSFALETRPEDLDTTYYVALGSFDDNRWHWLIETQLPEVNIEFTDEEQHWISQLGNLYWVVLVDGGKSLFVDKATINTGSGTGGGGPPGGGCVAIGPISSIDDLSIIVENHYFIHNADTQWIDAQGNLTGPDAFVPGMMVIVEGYEADNPVLGGGCIATSVQMLDNGGGGGGGGEFFVIDGPVTEANAEYFFVDFPNGIAPQLIFHDAQTIFVNADGTPATWEDLVAGECVHAEGEILDDNSWLARFVIIENGTGGGGGGGGGESFVLDGIVTAIGPESISVAEGPAGVPQTVGHDDHTLFLLPDGMEGEWTDVAVGDLVHIDGQITADGAWLADVVMSFGDNGGGGGGGGGGEFFTMDGELLSANESSFTVSGFAIGEVVTFMHDEQTLWLLSDGTEGDWQSIAIGSHVLVDAKFLDDNSLLALTVLEMNGPPAGG